MTERQRFNATMHYQERDRCPICDFGFWTETLDVWHEQGLPKTVTYHDYNAVHTDVWFGMDSYTGGPGEHVDLLPAFEYKVLEDRGDHEIVQNGDGVVLLQKKVMGSIPHHVSHTLVDRDSWNKHFKWRLDPTSCERYPKDWDAAVAIWRDENREHCVTLSGGSLFGRLRDWMGMENIVLVPYDDPEWFGEMVETLADCIYYTLERVLDTGGKFDGCSMWEDMCYSGGPLLNPKHFKEYMVPQYRRINDLLRKHGVDVCWLDCDGKIDALIPLWLEAGVNCMFPIEVGTWGGDPVRYRREYGKDLLLMGGFDKHILAKSKEAITAEVERLTPTVEEGGFIPFADHRVPPDVPYENYLHYLREARRMWGKGVNLKPALFDDVLIA